MQQQNNNTYTPPPQGPMIPQPQIGAPRPRGWRERWMRNFGTDRQLDKKSELTIPNWLTGKAMVFFFVALLACWGFLGNVPDFDLIFVASLSVVLFFYGGVSISKSLNNRGEKQFLRNVFVVGMVLRILWILYLYFVFNPAHFGNEYGDNADTGWYMDFGKDLAKWISGDSKNTLSKVIELNGSAIDDTGYPMWLGVIYLIVGIENDVFVPFVLKCILGAYCSISIYRVAKRHFGDGVARIAAIFMCVNPNMIYWCGSMMKEAEMVFLVCLAVDNFDRVLTSGQRYTFRSLLPGMLAATALMFFRSALGIVIFMAVFAHIVAASRRVMSMGKKILAGVLVGAVLFVSMGDRIRTQSQSLLDDAQSTEKREQNLEFRANRDGGNSLAKYAGAAVFAPLIFTIPFPTFNAANTEQIVQIQLSGGSYIKNIFSFFVIIVLIIMLISGEWRRHVFILAYTVGYHLVLVMSNFAQSGRFHMPVWPMLMLFAAYGIQIAKTNAKLKRWFPIVLVVEVAICLFWNWFKLKGRGMI